MDHLVKAYQDTANTPEGKAAEAKGNKLDKEFLAVVSGPIYQAWQYVAQDWPEGEKVTYAGAIEVSIDADRIWTHVSPPSPKAKGTSAYAQKRWEEAVFAEAAIRQACKVHDYGKVLRFLAKHIKLGL